MDKPARLGRTARLALCPCFAPATPCLADPGLICPAVPGMLGRMRSLLPLLLVFSAGLPLTHSQEAAAANRREVDVGGRKIFIPPPAGFERIDGLNPEEDRVVAAMLSASNRYLARFGPSKLNTADAERSFSAQVMRKLEKVEVGESTFIEAKKQTRAELDQMQATLRQEMEAKVAEAEKRRRDETGADVALSVGDVAVLGYFDDSPESFGFTIAMNLAEKNEVGSTTVKVVAAGLIVPVNGRLIYLYANADFNSPADQQWVERSVLAWRDAVLAVNPRMQGPSGRGPLFEGVGRSTLIGAVVGGCAALILVLFKKRKKR